MNCLCEVEGVFLFQNGFGFVIFVAVVVALIQGKGEWAITSVLHDATAVVSFSFLFYPILVMFGY